MMTQSDDRIIEPPRLLKKPILLKPNPPASTHQLSYNQYQNQKLKQQLEMGKHEGLLKKIEELHKNLYQKEGIIKQNKETHLRQLLLLEIQLKHQMEITARYDAEFKKFEANRNQMQHYFQMKLELVKKQMTEAFESQMMSERERAAEDLRLIKENYCTKIALIGEGFREKQFQFAENQNKSNNYELKISLIQSKLSQKTKALQNQTEKLLELEQKNKQNEFTINQLKKKISETQDQFMKKNQSLKQKALQQEKLKEQLYERFKAMKIQIENSQIKKQQLEKTNLNLKNQLELALRKYNYIQKELDQLNRKTYKNKQEYDKSPVQGRILESGRETERDREREREKSRDKEAIAKYVEEIERISKLNENLTSELQEKERQIANMEKRNSEELQREKQNYLVKLKELLSKNETQSKNYCTALQQEIRKLKEELSKRQVRLQEINVELEKDKQIFTKNLEFITKKGQELQDSLKSEEQQMHSLHERIDSQYLKQLQAQRKKIDELELTLNQTHELMANDAKEKKLIQAELQQLKKNKKK